MSARPNKAVYTKMPRLSWTGHQIKFIKLMKIMSWALALLSFAQNLRLSLRQKLGHFRADFIIG